MRETILSWLITMSLLRRKLVFAVALAVTLGLGAAAGQLTFDMRWSVLLPDTLPVVQEFKKIDTNFYQPGNMIIAIRGPEPRVLEQMTDEVTALLERELVCPQSQTLAECTQQKRYARYVYGNMPEEWLTEHSLRLLKPNDARRTADLFSDPRLLPYLIHLNDDFEAEYMEAENVKDQERQIVASLDAVQRFVNALDAAADGEVDDEKLDRSVRDLTIGNPYTLSLDSSMSLIMVSSTVSTDEIEHVIALDKRIEELVAPLAAAHPGYQIERTGMTAVSRDEMDSVGPQTALITLGALGLIFLLLTWNFRSLIVPIFALIPIVLGIIWSMGIIALILGQMNIVTSMIMVVLLGLGIDFSIHVANRYHEEIARHPSIRDALRATIAETAKGVITGAVTTAAAFYTLMVADTRGIKEFGFCAGTGVLVTLVAVLWLLPALLAFRTARQQRTGITAERSRDFMLIGRIAERMGRVSLVVIAASLILTLGGFWAGSQLPWEWNFLNLEAEGLRSVELQDEIIEKFKFSISFSMLTAETIEASRTLRKELKSKGIVGEVDDISLWVSRPDVDRSLAHLGRLRRTVQTAPAPLSFLEEQDTGADAFTELQLPERRVMLGEELDRLWANLVEIQALSIIAGQDRVEEKTRHLVATREHREDGLLRRVADRFFAEANAVNWKGVDLFAQKFGQRLHAQVLKMTQGDAPVTFAMVPEHIRAKYISHSGSPGFLLQILPRQNLYEREELELFQSVTAKVHPNVTGTPQLILNMNQETLREGRLASGLAIIVIFGVLLLDFRRHMFIAPLAFLPLISGMALMLGGMWLFGEKLNYINMIALPVIIGIGVDDGVHFFHRYLQEGRGSMTRAIASVGRAMLMTSLTTMIGFGSLTFYMMRGMQSLGFALFVGVGMCFIVTITLLPALIAILERRKIQIHKRRH